MRRIAFTALLPLVLLAAHVPTVYAQPAEAGEEDLDAEDVDGDDAEAAAKDEGGEAAAEGEAKAGEDGAGDAAKEGDAPADGAAPGAEPPAEELSEEGGALEFAQAMEQLLLENYPEAARLAYVSMKKTKPSADKYESAQFVLGEALAGIGFNQAAAEYYFAVAEQRQNEALFPRALAGLETLARRGMVDEDKLLKGVLAEANLANVPTDVEDFLHYYRGLSNLRMGYRSWAAKDFGAVRKEGFYGQSAQFIRVVTMVKDGKNEKALKLVDDLLKADAEDDDAKLDDNMRARFRLVRARLLYESGMLKEAIEEYSTLRDVMDAEEGEILIERSWAYFRKGAYHDSMGLLYAIGAPSSRDLFLPDQYILRGLIYQRFCHFRAAKAAVRAFRDRYGEAVAALKRGDDPESVDVVGKAARIIPEVFPTTVVMDAVLAEQERLESFAGAFEEGGLLTHLNQMYEMLRARAEKFHTKALRNGARIAAERLLEADEQANLLEYEVGVSIFKPIAPSSGEVKLRQKAEEVPGHGTMTYYPFDGEYWTDELPQMRFLIQDRCVE